MQKIILKKEFIISIVFIVISIFYFYLKNSSSPTIDECEHAGVSASSCYEEKAREIVRTYGISSAIDYASNVVERKMGFNSAHMILHAIGQEAFNKTNNLDTALAYVPRESITLDNFSYEGYVHGVFQEFFLKNRDKMTRFSMMQNACSKYFNLTKPPEERIENEIATQCFHGIGHALMYVDNNNIEKSMLNCKDLPHQWMRDWCYYGVSMEMTYLYTYLPHYGMAMGKPDPIVKKNIVSVCESLDVEFHPECARFIGAVYLYKNHKDPNDFVGAFKECSILKKYQDICIGRVSLRYITKFFQDNFTGIIETCKKAGQSERVCLNMAGLGIFQGSAGVENKKKPFCSLLDKNFRESCEESIKSWQTASSPK